MFEVKNGYYKWNEENFIFFKNSFLVKIKSKKY